MADVATTTYKKVSTSSHIHEDIAFSILSKLPIKSLTRFTCVQKSWSLLFQNPNFINIFCTNFFTSKHHDDDYDDDTHILLWENHDSLCFLSGERFEDRVILDWPPLFQYDDSAEILGSSSVNGILCLYDVDHEDHDNDTTTIVLWNPSTGEFKIIPPGLQPHENFVLNYPPDAFGYDHVKDDYKILREVRYPIYFEDNWIYLPDKDDPFWETDVHQLDMNPYYWEEEDLIAEMYDPFWEIYSLKSNSWRKLNGVDMSVSLPGLSFVNLNKFSHWLTSKNYMVSFDYSNEFFFATTLPSDSYVMLTCGYCHLVVLNGSVCLISNNVKMTYINIWILGELSIKESWTKFFVVIPLNCVMRPIGAGKKSIIFFRKKDYQLVWFDFRTQRIGEIGVKGDLKWRQIVNYKENFLPFGGMNN